MGIISNIDYGLMNITYKVLSLFHDPSKLLERFDIKAGYTVVDYGCGPGRYIKKISELVGNGGKVYAIDIHKLAIKSVKKIIRKNNIKNVIPLKAVEYSCSIESNTADLIYALDMFHQIQNPEPFLKELNRLIKDTGLLIIDDGHQLREKTVDKIKNSALWEIIEEKERYLKCKPIKMG